MSGYHLCQVKKARHPYFIESISTNIFTIEELCFYLEKNIYLPAKTINKFHALSAKPNTYRLLHVD